MRFVFAAAAAALCAAAPASGGIITFEPGTYSVEFDTPTFIYYRIGNDLVITNGDISNGSINGKLIQFGGSQPYLSKLTSFDARGSGEVQLRGIKHDGPIPPPDLTLTLTDEWQHFTVNSEGFFIYLQSDVAFELDNADFSAIPEPASWAMMIAGFGLAGAAARRRRAFVAAVGS